MAKVREIVTDVLDDLAVHQSEAPIESDDANIVIRAMNDLMAMWQAVGIYLGYTEVNNMGDIVTVPNGALMGIKGNLAIIVAPKFNKTASNDILMKAEAGYKAILSLSVDTTESAYPDTLPVGSGNASLSSKFYGTDDGLVLEETGGAIALEDA